MIVAKTREMEAARAEKGMNLCDLAVAAKMSSSGLGRIEKGTRSVSAKSARKLADALEKSVTDLFDFHP